MKGIILAGGSGTRLYPLTQVVSKQLLPVYDKPMIYYPLSVLMLGGIRDILVITTPRDAPMFRALLGDGDRFGLRLSYAEQSAPNGIAEALLIGREFLDGGPSCLILGDNVFYGSGLGATIRRAREELDGCTLFGYRVQDPQRYGVIELGPEGDILSIEEKPTDPRSHLAVTGLYLYDATGPELAARLRPSARGELEITDLNRMYVEAGRARVEVLGRGMAWLDTGSHASLLEASQFVQVLQHRQGTHIACLEEIAFNMGYIDAARLQALAEAHAAGSYGDYLRTLAREASGS
jgi:glucose-1-phosphate thymidylyltransferase